MSVADPRVRFCPFCGGGTLFIDPDNPTGFGCMKCKRGFQVAVRTDAEPPAPRAPSPEHEATAAILSDHLDTRMPG